MCVNTPLISGFKCTSNKYHLWNYFHLSMWETETFHTRALITHRGVAPSPGEKPRGRLMPRISMEISSGERWVISMPPPPPGTFILTRQHCARGGTVACAVAWTTDRRITVWRRERESLFVSLVFNAGPLVSHFYFWYFGYFLLPILLYFCFSKIFKWWNLTRNRSF